MHFASEIFAVGLLEKFRVWSATTSGTSQTLIFFGVVIVIALIVFGWAVLVRDQPHRHHHRSHSKSVGDAAHENSSTAGSSPIHRKKHRRHKHRPLNPTLSETRGLPAPRDDKTPPKSQL